MVVSFVLYGLIANSTCQTGLPYPSKQFELYTFFAATFGNRSFGQYSQLYACIRDCPRNVVFASSIGCPVGLSRCVSGELWQVFASWYLCWQLRRLVGTTMKRKFSMMARLGLQRSGTLISTADFLRSAVLLVKLPKEPPKMLVKQSKMPISAAKWALLPRP